MLLDVSPVAMECDERFLDDVIGDFGVARQDVRQPDHRVAAGAIQLGHACVTLRRVGPDGHVTHFAPHPL
ncbi:hypothetical protein BDK89_1668 [Ilumatobacter fluminis]|uniref:Uncharacterized protein n=1 Tax=Ilumatobacter fluminis TaxID=467091 RepID=A0A4R7I0L8_9ACTN|nr:hypothetical protein BDK89_1668 [Ilumatobacter fluminis]